jgi:hypothetical protein
MTRLLGSIGVAALLLGTALPAAHADWHAAGTGPRGGNWHATGNGWHGNAWHGHPNNCCWRGHNGGWGPGAALGAIAGAAIIGGALAATLPPPVVYAPPPAVVYTPPPGYYAPPPSYVWNGYQWVPAPPRY